MEARYQMEVAMEKSKKVIEKVNQEFSEIFGRDYSVVEQYRCEGAEIILIAMGSICSTIRDVVDDMRGRGEKVGLLKVRNYRPFPKKEIYEAVKNADRVAILDKNISFGMGGALYTEIKANIDVESCGFIVGLGGRDITPEHIEDIVNKTRNPTKEITWIGLKEEV